MRNILLSLGLVPLLALAACPLKPVAAASPAGPLSSAPSASNDVSGAAIVQTALRYVGYPYTAVGNSPSLGFSCIGFVSYVYQSNGIPLPDDLWDAMAYAPAVSFADLQPGDVLWFQNTVWPGLSHTAIYLGGGRFVHAEWYNRGVVTSSFTNDPVDGDYWIGKYLGASRPWGAVAVQPGSAVAGDVAQSSAQSPATKPAIPKGPRARVEVDALNIRLRPSLQASVRAIAGLGTPVVVLRQYGAWDGVQLRDGSFGWVIATAVGVTSPARNRPHTLLGRSILPLEQSRVSGLRLHRRPGLAAAVVTTVHPGQRLLVLQAWNNWLHVLLPGGTRGWVSASYVIPWTIQSSARRAARRHAVRVRRTIRAANRFGARLTAGVRVHYRPGLRAPVQGLAAAGTRVSVLRTSGDWALLRFRNGRTGWVDRLFVTRSH